MKKSVNERLLEDAMRAYDEESFKAKQYKAGRDFWYSEYEAVNMRLRLYPFFFFAAVVSAFFLYFYFV